MEKIVKKIMTKCFYKQGYSGMASNQLSKMIWDDFLWKESSFKEKMWAWRRGFISDKIQSYGLTEANYQDYLSDFSYYKMHPINNNFKKWIDDKLTTKYVLSKYNEYLPEYYCVLNKGKIQKLMEGENINNFDDLLLLIEIKKSIALKLTAASLGVGFYKLVYDERDFYVNNEKYTKVELKKFLMALDGYLVTEYIFAHSEIRKISDYGLNTLRLMVINEPESTYVANGFMRFGTQETGAVDNASQGGIFTIVDVETGRYSQPNRIENKKLIKCEIHPDTKVKIEGYLPNWEIIIRKLTEISRYIAEVKYLGFDIAITEKGFKIIEINSQQDINWYQYHYPLLKNNKASEFFQKHLK